MILPLPYLIAGAIWLGLLVVVDRLLVGERRAAFRFVAAAASAALLFLAVQRRVTGGTNFATGLQVLVVALALAALLWEWRAKRRGRPLAPALVRRAGIALGLAGFVSYWASAAYGYPQFFHVWDQYHYYIGAKYFPEPGYRNLYRCTAAAQDELGTVEALDRSGRPYTLDLSAEVRAPRWAVRDIGGTNMVIPGLEALAGADACRARFGPTRWAAFKADVLFFRLAAGPDQWRLIQRDHGFNPPPVWLLAGLPLASLHPASTGSLVTLAFLDVALLTGMFAALAWAFGWRVVAVGADFWGTQALAPFFWTGGAFLRQDWLFLLVLSACLARKRYFALAGGALAWSGLIRIFPFAFAFGWLVVALSA